MVEDGNLFDPKRPNLGSELEALRQHLEALSSGPGTRRSRLDRPAGALAVPCVWSGARAQLWGQRVTSCLGRAGAAGPPFRPHWGVARMFTTRGP